MAPVTESPVVAWVAIGIAVLIAVSQALPKVLGPLSQTIHDWAASKRTADDARVEDLAADVAYLRSEVAALRSEMQERDRLAWAHTTWDQMLLVEIARLDPSVLQRLGDPPSLYPAQP